MTPKGIKWQRGRRSRSLAQSTTSTSTETSEGLNIAQSNLNAMLELQRVSYLFQGTSFISEAEFVINCKVVMNLLQYPHSDVNSQQQALLVEVIENAVITFVLRILPLVFQELIAPTSLLHPISPPMMISLLEFADTYVSNSGDFSLQFRMAATRLLIQDNEDVALAFSMCQMLPKIQPTTKWQPVMNPVKANPTTNMHGSISLPEIRPPVFPESPSLDCSSLFGSPIPSLSSLLNCNTASSTSVSNLHQYDPNHVNVIAESISLPVVSLIAGPVLSSSFSAPNLQSVRTPERPTNAISPPVFAAEGVFTEFDTGQAVSFTSSAPNLQSTATPELLADITRRPALASESFFTEIDTSQEGEFLFSPSLFSPATDDEDYAAATEGDVVLSMPEIDICVELATADEPSEDAIPQPHLSTFASQDDLSRLISGPDVGEEPPSPSPYHLSPSLDASTDADFSLSIGPPLSQIDATAPGTTNEPNPLSPLPTQVSSPLSSPPQIIVPEMSDLFLNTFEEEVQKRPPSPYNKRLRSASNNPETRMKRASRQEINRIRAVSTSASRHKAQLPLDPDLAALTLPPPPQPDAIALPKPPPAVKPPKSRGRSTKPGADSKAQTARRKNQIVIGDNEPPPPRQPSQRSISTSVNKENS